MGDTKGHSLNHSPPLMLACSFDIEGQQPSVWEKLIRAIPTLEILHVQCPCPCPRGLGPTLLEIGHACRTLRRVLRVEVVEHEVCEVVAKAVTAGNSFIRVVRVEWPVLR